MLNSKIENKVLPPQMRAGVVDTQQVLANNKKIKSETMRETMRLYERDRDSPGECPGDKPGANPSTLSNKVFFLLCEALFVTGRLAPI